MSSTTARDIPKRAEPAEGIPAHCSTTPSGTVYSNTPGGTRIVYDRNTLLNLANSPMAKTPPSNLAFVPGVTMVHTTSEGHLAPPANTVFAGASQRQREKAESGGPRDGRENDGREGGAKTPDEDSRENVPKEAHDPMFEMDME